MENTINEQFFNIKKVLSQILNRWYLVLGSILVSIGVIFIINRYTNPVHLVLTTLQVNKTQGVDDPLALLYNSPQSGQSGLNDEKVVLTSYPLLLSTLQDFDYKIAYYYGNQWNLVELYKNSPIEVITDSTIKDQHIPFNKVWECHPMNGKQYLLKTETNKTTLDFGKFNTIEGFTFKINITKPEVIKSYNFIAFKHNELSDLINQFRGGLKVNPVSDKIINISYQSENVDKASDFLNILAQKIIERDIQEKRYNSQKTVEFIDNQMAINYDSLKLIETQLEQFKNEKVAIDPQAEGSRLYGNIQSLENEKGSILLSDQYYDYLSKSILENNVEEIVVPSSVGIEDALLNGFITRLINLQMEAKLFLSDNKIKNPILLETQETIEELKANILSNIQNQKIANELKIKDIDLKIQKYAQLLKRMPAAAHELGNIKRGYNLSETLYLMLMEKKMEAGVMSAAITSDYKVINQAYNTGIISASPTKNYITGIIVALIIPIGFILLFGYFDDRIKSKEEVSLVSNIPILGTVIHLKKGEERYHLASPLMESFRNIRANLNYLGYPTQVILVTSSISGEGKTFCSYHLAHLLSMTQKKVVWVNADLRKNPEKNNEFPTGLSSYLAGLVEVEDTLIEVKGNSNLKVINPGKLPPNPSELLISTRMKQLVAHLKENFDYIVIDTPPAAIFSDPTELQSIVDYTILTVRHNFTKQTNLRVALEKLHISKNQNISIIYNDIKAPKILYNYGTYSNGQKKKQRKADKLKI